MKGLVLSHVIRTSLLLLPLFIQLSTQRVYSQDIRESGYPPIYYYSAKEYKETPQNWAILEDSRGIMYFGNNAGILEFDGSAWRTIRVPNRPVIRALTSDFANRIYVGAQNEFGMIVPDSVGRMTYHSLVDKVREEEREFGDVWGIIVMDEGVYYQAKNKLFLWDGKKMRSWQAQHEFKRSYRVGNQVYIYQKGFGLCRLEGERVILCKGGDVFKDGDIAAMVHYDENHMLIATSKKGLFLLEVDDNGTEKSISYFPTQIDDFFATTSIKCALRLSGDLISIGTHGRGVVIIDMEGRPVQVINKSKGLHDEIIYSQYLDSHGNLWLALSNGISRVEFNSPVTIFDEKTGLDGTIESLVRHKGILYLGTHKGLYYLAGDEGKSGVVAGFNAGIKRVESVNMECWTLFSYKNQGDTLLLLGLNNGIYQLVDNQPQAIVPVDKYYPWTFHQSKYDPARVFIGHDGGLASIYRNGTKWIDEGEIGGVHAAVRVISEDKNGNIWMGTVNQGIIRMEIQSYDENSIGEFELTHYNNEDGLPDNGFHFSYFGKKWSLVGTNKGLYKFSKDRERFEPDTIFGGNFVAKDRAIHRINEDYNGNLWMVTIMDRTIEVGIATPSLKDRALFNTTPFLEISKDIIHAVYHDRNGVSWMGGPEGLFRFDANISKNFEREYATTIRKVRLGEDSVIFWGAYFNENQEVVATQVDFLKSSIAYLNNSLTFDFAAPVYAEKGSNFYSYFLEGFDKEWSAWKQETKAVYTNLHEGTYRFRVKARNNYRHESIEAMYEFTILPPWYRTMWAYIMYVLLFIGFVYGAVTISTRSLKAIIRERTAEIVLQKDEIEEKNKDIMDSIKYAERIQQAILPTTKLVGEYLDDFFILYKPKDIVSGDFYWIDHKDDKVMFAAVDCTGHGVPGAFMSIVGHNALNQAVIEHNLIKPADILNQLNITVNNTLRQRSEESSVKDGMDIALCTLDMKARKVEFAGANNPLYHIRNGEITQTKGDKQPIGAFIGEDIATFTNHEADIQPGDTLYVFTDGFADQFGGPGGKKFKYQPFRELLVSMQDKTMVEQRDILDDTIEEWRGDMEQIDDICVIGLRIGD